MEQEEVEGRDRDPHEEVFSNSTRASPSDQVLLLKFRLYHVMRNVAHFPVVEAYTVRVV
ncbi:MAG: hypothetical protein MjAS7_2180 [Metallosphaera javensis (ex Sakai et al. 2022)]|nr:MAG: hypothetical protein MjAS7_2180 [Metallosphaera javensis (ex Sakai et al. 2022)]